MRTWFRNPLQASGPRRPVRRASCRPRIESLEDRHLLSSGFVQTALVSDIPGLAPNTNSAVVNPWGFTVSPSGQFLLSDNGSGNAALINADGTSPPAAPIVIPPPAGSPPPAAPTGQVLNTTSGFVISEGGHSAPAAVLFSTEDGTISGFNSAVDPGNAILAVDNSKQTYQIDSQTFTGAVYKGLAEASADGQTFIYATNFRSSHVDVFDKHFHNVTDTTFKGKFSDPNIPTGFAPFGIQAINGILFVTYAMQDAAHHDDVAGPGNGFIDEFDTSGDFLKRFASGTAAGGTLTALNSPWGMAVAPAGFGNFGGDLLVGNFGDSHVSVFVLVPGTGQFPGQFLGQLTDTHGNPLVLNGGFKEKTTKGLWGINFGNGAGGAGTNTLFFAAGINEEADGLFGEVNFVPSPVISGLELTATAAIATNDIWATGNAAVDQLFDAAIAAGQPLSFAGHKAPARQAADNGARAVFPGDIGL